MELKLPPVQGRIRYNASLNNTNWFRVGGNAKAIFKPANTQDLAQFLKQIDKSIPVYVLGVGSNVIIRDGGFNGVIIKLGREFAGIEHANNQLICGAGALDSNIAMYCAEHAIKGLEFLSGIPGTIGGNIPTNAGAYGAEIKDYLIKLEAVDYNGNIIDYTNEQLDFEYRICNKIKQAPFIVTKVWFKAEQGDAKQITDKITQIKADRELSQPVKSCTGGSTFKNPEGHKAWQLIDMAGCRGMQIGGAQVSTKHCNFLINTGDATAEDLENLGNQVRQKVLANSGVELEWEIKIIGAPK